MFISNKNNNIRHCYTKVLVKCGGERDPKTENCHEYFKIYSIF